MTGQTELLYQCHSALESNQFPHRCLIENLLASQERVWITALYIHNGKIYATIKHVECVFAKCCLKFKVLLLVIRVVFGFMLANMRARMCLIRKRSCSGRGGRLTHTSNVIGHPVRRCFVCAPLANDPLISTKGLSINGSCYRTSIKGL